MTDNYTKYINYLSFLFLVKQKHVYIMIMCVLSTKTNISDFYSTEAHPKYVPLNTFLQHRYYLPYCTFCGSFKVKRPVSGTKMQVQ